MSGHTIVVVVVVAVVVATIVIFVIRHHCNVCRIRANFENPSYRLLVINVVLLVLSAGSAVFFLSDYREMDHNMIHIDLCDIIVYSILDNIVYRI